MSEDKPHSPKSDKQDMTTRMSILSNFDLQTLVKSVLLNSSASLWLLSLLTSTQSLWWCKGYKTIRVNLCLSREESFRCLSYPSLQVNLSSWLSVSSLLVSQGRSSSKCAPTITPPPDPIGTATTSNNTTIHTQQNLRNKFPKYQAIDASTEEQTSSTLTSGLALYTLQ